MKLTAQLRKGFTQAPKYGAGFTLIELLVVIAVIGVLASIVLLAVNPGEQLARGRDTSRISTVTQIGRAIQGYYTAASAVYPAAATWDTLITASGDVKQIPADVGTGVTACIANVRNSEWCYVTGASDTVIFTRLESKLYNSKCITATDEAFWAFASSQARAGGYCWVPSSEPDGAAAVGAPSF